MPKFYNKLRQACVGIMHPDEPVFAFAELTREYQDGLEQFDGLGFTNEQCEVLLEMFVHYAKDSKLDKAAFRSFMLEGLANSFS